MPTQALRDVEGFDAHTFRDAIVEDVELGYRLAQRGWRVLYHPDARCEHHHVLTADDYFRRHFLLGANLTRMALKHDEPRMLWLSEGQSIDAAFRRNAQATIEARHDVSVRALAKLREFEQQFDESVVPATTLQAVRALVRQSSHANFLRGALSELEGADPGPVIEQGAPRGELTTIIVVSHDSLDQVQRCVQELRRCTRAEHPCDLVVVDNGSTDGSAEWLAEQDDLLLLRNDTNAGAPRARNQALAHAQGRWIVFMDSDVMVTPGWLDGLVYHAAVDAGAACVGPVTDRAAHGQALANVNVRTAAERDALATVRAETHRRKSSYASLMSSFCMLVPRAVIERIGGFDERFSPWGFEDDDFSLRARLAGGRLRVAHDVFVQHESYNGPKRERHEELLLRNWRRFAAKWNLRNAARHGDYAGLDELFERTWSDAELNVPIAPEPALPQSPAREPSAATTVRNRS